MPLILPGQKRQVEFSVTTRNGEIVLQFSHKVDNVNLSPQSAATIARALAQAVQSLQPSGPKVIQ